MELKSLFHENISFFDQDLKSKDEVINFLSQQLLDKKYIKNIKEFNDAVLARETEGSTGVGDAIAIPHVLNKTVNASAIAFLKLKNPIDWKSLDDKPVDLIFLIMTNGKDGNEHLTALANLSTYLMKSETQKQLHASTKFSDIMTAFAPAVGQKPTQTVNANEHYDVVGITACPTGIAHTYMAAEKIEEYAKQKGLTVKVETQGRRGIENRLTEADIANAKVIILAHDKALEGLKRFNGKQVIDTSTKEAIFNGAKLIEQYKNGQNLKTIQASGKDGEESGELNLKKFLEFKANLLGGVSRMLPFVVAGGIILGIGFLIDFAAGNGSAGDNFGTINATAGWFSTIGKTSLSMMVCILGGYVAYSIIGPQGLMPGIVAGLFSSSIMTFAYGKPGDWANMWGKLIPLEHTESGFIGALVGGYLSALIVFGWMKAMAKFPKGLQGVRDIVFVPVFSLLCVGLMMFAINIPLGYVMGAISDGISWLAAHDLILLVSTIIGLMMCVDMGGPINKIAYTIGTTTVGNKLITDSAAAGYNDQTIIMAASMLAGMLPPIMIAMSTVIFPRVWSTQDRDAAKANWLMGACFVTEGAIPFMVKDAKRISVTSILGGIIVGLLVGLLKIKLGAPHGGIFVFALISTNLVDSGQLTGLSIGVGIGSALAILVGASLLSAFVLSFWKLADIKKGKLTLESTNGVKEALEAKIEKDKNDLAKLKLLNAKMIKYNTYEAQLKTKQAEYAEKMVKQHAIKETQKETRRNLKLNKSK